jgi:isopentenyl-diphosphate delta-isomerase
MAGKKKARSPGTSELIEVVDSRNRCLGAMSRKEVHEQGLMHRSVLVLLYNKQHKLYLQQRSKEKAVHPGCWDLSATGHVLAGESRQEAACRELEEELRIRARSLYLLHELPASKDTGFAFVSLFSTGPVAEEPLPQAKEAVGGLFVEPHELDYLVRDFSHLLTPALIHVWRLGCLFSAQPGAALTYRA